MVCLWGLDPDLEVCLPLDLEWDVDIHHHLVVLEDMLLRLDQEGLVECLLNKLVVVVQVLSRSLPLSMA